MQLDELLWPFVSLENRFDLQSCQSRTLEILAMISACLMVS